MQKVLFTLTIMLVTALIVLVIFFGLTPTGRSIWNQYKNRDSVKDEVTDEQRAEIEHFCRDMIAAWAAEAKAYKEGDTEAKGRANQTATAYNEYMAKNAYVFGETLPEGIYAVIEMITD